MYGLEGTNSVLARCFSNQATGCRKCRGYVHTEEHYLGNTKESVQFCYHTFLQIWELYCKKVPSCRERCRTSATCPNPHYKIKATPVTQSVYLVCLCLHLQGLDDSLTPHLLVLSSEQLKWLSSLRVKIHCAITAVTVLWMGIFTEKLFLTLFYWAPNKHCTRVCPSMCSSAFALLARCW